MSSGSSQSDFDLRIAVLGPIRIWRDGIEQEVPTAKPRSVLALLLAEHNRPVSAADVINVIWADGRPLSAVNLVQKYVGQLRRFLGDSQAADGAAQPLTLERGGYRLRLDVDVVDLLRFRRLVTNADGDDVETFESLKSALELWQGTSFGGLPASVRSHPVFESIDSEYFAAMLRAAKLGESLGYLDRLLSLLHQASTWRPLDESIHAWWILALAAGGRQAEALSAYASIRRRLVDELGLEPGRELRDAQRRVLRQDGELLYQQVGAPLGATLASVMGGESDRGAQPSSTNPRRSVSLLTADSYGRDEDLEGLIRRLTAAQDRLVTVTGLAGVGKTWLANQAAYLLTDRFARIVRAGLASVACTDLVLDAIGAAMTEPVDGVVDVPRRLAAQPTLLVLDNLEHLDNISPVLVDLLRACPDLRILATSRRPTGTVGEQEWPLGPMPIPGPDDCDPSVLNRLPSVRLFVDRAQALRPAFALTTENAKAIGQLCRRLDGLPLAIELAAAQCRALEPGDLLRSNGELLISLPATGGRPSLQTALQASYDLLDEDCRKVLHLLAPLPSGWSLDTAAAVLGDMANAARNLNKLASYGMVVLRPGTEDRYEMLETIRRYALQRNRSAPGLPEHRHRMLSRSCGSRPRTVPRPVKTGGSAVRRRQQPDPSPEPDLADSADDNRGASPSQS